VKKSCESSGARRRCGGIGGSGKQARIIKRGESESAGGENGEKQEAASKMIADAMAE